MTKVSAVLLDADGVTQSVPHNWIEQWGTLLDSPRNTKAFLEDIFTAEAPHATGEPGFQQSIEGVLRKWDSIADIDQALSMWTLIELNHDILSFVQELRNRNIFTGLATNQHQYRLEYMQDVLRYEDYFDALYVSCEVGYKKPSKEYFSYIIDALTRKPSEILFIDDSEKNVMGAKAVGINAELFHMREGKDQLRKLIGSYGVSDTVIIG